MPPNFFRNPNFVLATTHSILSKVINYSLIESVIACRAVGTAMITKVLTVALFYVYVCT